MTLVPEAENIEAYLAADSIIDHGHPAIRTLAAQLRAPDDEGTARAAFEYVRDKIAHSYDEDRWSAAYRASDVLASGNAICHGQAHLLTALLRAEGIPAGVTYQRLSALHALVAVHWPAGWVRVDPRNADARFATTPESERLVYPDAPSSEVVHASVPAEVSVCLARAVPDAPGFDYLPIELPRA